MKYIIPSYPNKYHQSKHQRFRYDGAVCMCDCDCDALVEMIGQKRGDVCNVCISGNHAWPVYDVKGEKKLLLARVFMQEAHKGQTRWDGSSYESHPIKVVEILQNMGFGVIDILCAGYLHDLLEDTLISQKDIEERFGQEVAGYVKELTFKKGSDEYYWLKCSELSPNAKVIKIADILANLGDKGRKSEHFVRKRVRALEILLKDTLK